MRQTPKTLKKVKVPKKPRITLNLSDRLNQAQMWLSDTIANLAGKAIAYIVPKWVWFSFLGFLILLIGIYGLTR